MVILQRSDKFDSGKSRRKLSNKKLA